MKAINNFINEKLKITKKMLNNQYEFVDLDLPSGTLWAKCNVGAKEEHEYGGYFAWGETETKDTYNCNTYKFSIEQNVKYDAQQSNMSKYNYKDNIKNLQLEDDVANVVMGGDWHIPTYKQFNELLKLKNVWVENYNNTGINGRLFTGKNGNTLFLPGAGYIRDNKKYDENTRGLYHCTMVNYHYAHQIYNLFISRVSKNLNKDGYRYYGESVRGVMTK
jgi:uncharacterized protein (TIGR02145 family)